ncbi:unnamed protein product, partial [Allacma fusca]
DDYFEIAVRKWTPFRNLRQEFITAVVRAIFMP